MHSRTLTPVIGDPLVLYVVCRIEDQGPKPPWKVPGTRVVDRIEPSTPVLPGEPNQSPSPSAR